MNLESEKEFIKSEIDKITDIHLVEAIKNMLAVGKAKIFEHNLQPLTKEEFLQRNQHSQSSIQNNQLIAQEDAQEYFKKKHDKA